MINPSNSEELIQVVGSPCRLISVAVGACCSDIYFLCARIVASALPDVDYEGRSIDAFVDLMFDNILNSEFRLTIVLLQGRISNSASHKAFIVDMQSVFQQIADDLEPYPERQILVAWN